MQSLINWLTKPPSTRQLLVLSIGVAALLVIPQLVVSYG